MRGTGGDSMTSALIVAPGYPYPIDGGNKVALHGYVVAMKAASIDHIDFLGFKTDSVAHGEFSSTTFVEKPPRLTGRGLIRHLAGKSILMERFFSSYFLDQLRALGEKRRYDVVLFQHAYMAQYLTYSSDIFKSTLRIASSEVLESRAYRQKAKLAGDPVRRALFNREARLLDQQETRAFSGFDKVTFFSKEDFDHYRNCGGKADGLVVNLGLDMSRYAQLDPPPAGDLVVGFFGSFSWFANLDALNYLLREIWPAVKKGLPTAKLKIAGRDIPAWASEYSGAGVEVLGRVDSIRDFLSDVHAVVSPIRIGGGVRLKILETLAWGRPVISTLAGVEGLEDELRRFVRVANSGSEFLAALQPICSNDAARLDTASACVAVRRQYDAARLSGLFGV